MANKDDYLTDYRCFFENFAQTYNPHDQLPVKLGSYKLASYEVVGGIIDWTTQYLNQKKCPQSLLSPLIKIIIEEVRALCRKQTLICGFNPSSNAYDPLRLMQCVVTKTNDVCLRYLDNSKLCSLPSPGPPYNAVSICAIKNSRRRMEDRHVVIHDLNTLFLDEEVSPSSYYAIFDGHAGQDAAAYSCAHLHQFLGESKYFISNPEQALKEAFLKTDTLFNDKCQIENFRSGTTALCVLLKHKEKALYIAWVGDSQAVIVSQGQCIQCVQPHKPCREDEKNRIEQEGGTVIHWGTWRVNGQLAVSRAIGDVEYKPYVTAIPDIIEIPLSGMEDFLILGCDGLWDVISEKDAARQVYDEIIHNPDDIESVSQHLVQLAKEKGSCDNISVIVVFLREPSKVAAEAHWATRHNLIMDTLDNANATNPFANSNNGDIKQKEDYIMNLGEGFKQNGTETLEFIRATNGKRLSHEFDEDDDLGPETDVDAIDDVLLTTALSAKNLMDEIVNNNSSYETEKATLETDTDLIKKQSVDEFENFEALREETPTPPVESVQETSGLVDNVAESGEESEDEWNYIKGDQAEKENINPSQSDKEICELTSDLDAENMSQLNPNAAEFVPISPKRTTASPSYDRIMDDLVIAQSPKRGPVNDYDINVPNPQEFESEIKLRPSNVQECANGDQTDNPQALTSQEIMENLLNGKSIEEIEFQPNSSPVKLPNTGEFHFGPNSTPFLNSVAGFMDQSEALSTKAVVGDDSNYLEDADLTNFSNINESQISVKDDNPMSMSFYQDKDNADNPFDLNKVQMLPENIDDFLEKAKDEGANSLMDTTISDLPEHDPWEHENVSKSPTLQKDDPVVEREMLSSPVQLQQASSPVPADDLISESNKASSPFCDEHESGVEDLSSPVPEVESILPGDQLSTIQVLSPEPIVSLTPEPTLEFSTDLNEIAHSPIVDVDEQRVQSPIAIVHESQSPFEDVDRPISQSPIEAVEDERLQSPIVNVEDKRLQSPIGDVEDPRVQSPILDTNNQRLQSPLMDISEPLQCPIVHGVKSPVMDIIEGRLQSPIMDLDQPSQELSAVVDIQEPLVAQSPIADLLQSSLIEHDGKIHSPVPVEKSPIASPIPEVQSSLTEEENFFTQGIHNRLISIVSSCEFMKSQKFMDLPLSPTKSSPQQSPLPKSPSPIQMAQSPIPASQELDSPVEDITSSVKDSPLPVASPTEKQSEDLIEEDAVINLETESVATTDVNSFLERSLIPDVESPLSGDDTQIIGVCNTGLDVSNEYVTENIEIKSETIVPEFPVQIVTTPSEESKTEDLQTEETKIVAAVAAASVAAVATTAAVSSAVAEKKSLSKPKTTPTAKKPLSKLTTAATKPPVKAPATRPVPSKTTIPKTSQSKTPTTSTKLTTVNKTTPKEKTPVTAKSTDKKPLLNGDAAKTSAKKAASTTTAPKGPTAKPALSKISPTKSNTEAKTRPATAPLTSTTRTIPKTNTARTATSTAKSTTSKLSTTTTSSPSKTMTTAPKPKSTVAASKPKPLAPDTKKQIKETTNKQITSTGTKPLSSAGRTTTLKGPGVGSTLTKATAKVDTKKPLELIRHSTTKPKPGMVKRTTKTVSNGVAGKVTTTTITETTLIKDVSPVIENNIIVDNSQVLGMNTIAD